MKVKDLMDIIKDVDPELEVYDHMGNRVRGAFVSYNSYVNKYGTYDEELIFIVEAY